MIAGARIFSYAVFHIQLRLHHCRTAIINQDLSITRDFEERPVQKIIAKLFTKNSGLTTNLSPKCGQEEDIFLRSIRCEVVDWKNQV